MNGKDTAHMDARRVGSLGPGDARPGQLLPLADRRESRARRRGLRPAKRLALGAFSRGLQAVLLSVMVLAGAPARAQQFKVRSLAAAPPRGNGPAIDLALLPTLPGGELRGVVATHSITTPSSWSAISLVMPPTAQPNWDPAGPMTLDLTGLAADPVLASSADRIILINGSATLEELPLAAWGSGWSQNISGPTNVKWSVGAVDGAGSGAFFLGSSSNPGAEGLYDPITGWSQPWSTQLIVKNLSMSGARMLVQASFGTSKASSNGGAITTSLFGLASSLNALSAPAGLGPFWAVGPSGSFMLIDDASGSWIVSPVTGAPANVTATTFVDVVREGQVAWILDGSGTLHRRAKGDALAWDPTGTSYSFEATGLQRGYALAISDTGVLLVVGADTNGQAAVAWRNRSPLAPTVGNLSGAEGAAGIPVQASAIDPDGDAVLLDWVCGAQSFTLGSGVAGAVSAPEDPALCPGQTKTLLCDVTAREDPNTAEGLVGASAQVQVTIEGADPLPPIIAAIGLSETTSGALTSPFVSQEGALLQATMSASDDCGLDAGATRWRLLDASGTELLRAPLGSGVFDFTAPAVTAPTDLSIELQVADAAGNQATKLAGLRLLPASNARVEPNCPARLVAGESAILTTTLLSGVVTEYQWSLAPGAPTGTILTPSGPSASLQTAVCGDGNVTVRLMPVGPTGGDLASCTIPIDPANTPPSLSLSPAEDPLVWRLPSAGSSLKLQATSSDCEGQTIILDWDLRSFPPVLWPAGSGGLKRGPVVGGTQSLRLVLGPEQLEAALGPSGVFEGTLLLQASDDKGSTPTPLSRTLRLVAVPTLLTEISLPEALLEPGRLSPLRLSLVSDAAVGEVEATLFAKGFELDPRQTPSMRWGCKTERTLPTVALGPPDGEGAMPLRLSGLAPGCPLELGFTARVGFGARELGIRDCAWSEGPLVCEAKLSTRREGMFGCTSAGGDGEGALDSSPTPALLGVLLGVLLLLGPSTRRSRTLN